MVAIRSATDHNAVDFVTGKTKVDPEAISTEEWVSILRAAAGELPINYMRGLKSMRQILQCDGRYSVARKIDGNLPLMRAVVDGEVAQTFMRPNAVFLSCADIGYNLFPSGTPSYELYQKAPRAPDKPSLGDDGLLPIKTGHILLSRDGKFYHLSVLWLPKTTWDERSMSSTPASFWYEADSHSFQLIELNDMDFHRVLETEQSSRIPHITLHRFSSALAETIGDLHGQYEYVLKKGQTINGYLTRIGEPPC